MSDREPRHAPGDREGELSMRERAFAVCAVRAFGARAEALCARRPGASALKRYAALLASDPALLRQAAELLDRPSPLGLAEVHPSWYTPPPASSRPEAERWLARRAYGHLVDMGASAEGASKARAIERLPPHTLLTLLESLGRRRVAIAFSGAPRAALAQLCARLGEPEAAALLAQVRAVSPQVSPDEVLAAQRAVFHLVREGLEGERDPARALFQRAGSGWLAPALAQRGADRLRRLAQRLPRPLGEVLLADGAGAASGLASEADQAQALGQAGVFLAGTKGL